MFLKIFFYIEINSLQKNKAACAFLTPKPLFLKIDKTEVVNKVYKSILETHSWL